MISTSCITGTGFMKCMPITCSGRLVRAAISVIEIEQVFVARIASGARRRRDRAKMLELESRFSVAASTTSAASFTAVERCAVVTRPRIASLSAR